MELAGLSNKSIGCEQVLCGLSLGNIRCWLSDLETLFVTAWAIWFNRNQVIHESKSSPHSQIWNLAVRTQEDYKNTVLYCRVQQAPDVGWAVPPLDVYKINVDGATAVIGYRSSVGVVIRDSRGMFVAAACKVLNGNYGAAVTELL